MKPMKVIAVCRGCSCRGKKKKPVCEHIVCAPGVAVPCECPECHPLVAEAAPPKLAQALAELRVRLVTTLELLDVALEQASGVEVNQPRVPSIGGRVIHFHLTSCGAGPGRRLTTREPSQVTCRSCLKQSKAARDLLDSLKTKV